MPPVASRQAIHGDPGSGWRIAGGPGDEPRRPDGDFLTPKSLLLLIIAGGIADLYAHNPRAGAAVLAAITALTLLWKVIS